VSGARFAKGPWEYNDPAKFTQGHGTFSETAVYAPGNAFPWRMCEVQGPNLETAAAPELLEAAETVLADLNERIDAACQSDASSVPVFAGIAALSDAINKARGEQ